MSAFLKQIWYMAAWSSEIEAPETGGALFRRRIAGEPILLFRQEDGAVAALTDLCSHRFAPLSSGTRVGDTVRCPYQGLTFDAGGACVGNPFSATVPKGAQIRTWPVVELHGAVWIWAGDPALANPSTIPDFSLLERPCGAPLVG
ncbi:Rieske 2Fe-2S domain-containing protein [Sphingomonas sp. RB3P16]|uniref:Rieske 2Fe-2S domain-containing protein n=1 Tax=Parasphingomonas frigoris TaxID=3096163 RepID=UPI002FC8645B